MKRKALFVGVNEYRDPVIQDLRYAENDAALLFAQFKAIGYDAVLMSSPTRSEVENKVAKMIEHMDGEDDVFLFYFAGHGFVAPGDDERLFCKDDFYHKLQYHSAGLSFAMLRDTTRQGGVNRIFILDACRSNAFAGQRGGGRPRDLVPMSKMMGESAVRDVRCHGGHAIWRSCSSGQCAMELEPYEHGVFSLAIDMVMSECLRAGRELEFDKPFMRLVVNKMQEISQGEQMPEDQYSGNWPGIVLIQGSGSSTYSQNFARITSQPIVVCPVCGRHNQIADSFRCRVCGRDYLCERHYDEANNCCMDCAAVKREKRVEREVVLCNGTCRETGICRTIILPGGVKMDMIYCSPGEFIMGSPVSEEGRDDSEKQHRVRLTKGFWLGKFPVTQEQWQSVMGDNPSHFIGGAHLPVECVSWFMCSEFAEKVTSVVRQQLGVWARLPTEAEWEYACRAGRTSAYFWGDSLNGDKANCDGTEPCGTTIEGTYLETTTLVGAYDANPWGFFDMHGNVWEWCSDWYGAYSHGIVVDPKGPASGIKKILRGGSWYDIAEASRSAARCRYYPHYSNDTYGFRLCCSEVL